MADYEIEVEVAPDASRFPERLASDLTEAERKAGPVKVAVEPDLGRDFKAKTQRDVRRAIEALDATVVLDAELSRTFKRDVQRMTKAALAGENLAVPIEATVGKDFRRDLQRSIRAATAGEGLEVTVTATLGRGFRGQLQRSIDQAAGEGKGLTVPVQARLAAGFRRDLQRTLDETLAGKPLQAGVALEVDRRAYATFVADVDTKVRQATEAALATGASTVVLRSDGSALAGDVLADIGEATTAASLTDAASVEVRADTKGAAADVAAVGEAADGSGIKVGSFVKASLLGLAAIGAAAGAAGLVLFKIGSSFDDAFDTIQTTTGATGSALAGLQDDFRAVAATVPSDFADIGTAVGQVNQRLGLTGELGQSVAGDLLNLSRITGTDLQANIDGAAGALQSFNIQGEAIPGALDAVFRASQASGVGVDKLTTALQGSGAALRVAGFSFEESTALLAQLERAGVPAESVIGSLSIAARKLAKDGKDPAKAIAQLTQDIRDAKTPTEALATAQAVFGRGAVGITDAVRSGKFELGDFLDVVKDGKGTIAATSAETADAAESYQLLKNQLKLVLEQPAAEFFGAIGDTVKSLSPALGLLAPAVAALVGGFGELASELIKSLVPVLVELLPALSPIGKALLPLVKIVAGLAVVLIRSLVPAFEELATPEVAETLGAVAQAFADIFVELAPLLPDVVKIALVFVQQLLPVMVALAPAIGAVARFLVPVLAEVARLAPLLLLGLAFKAAVSGLLNLGGKLKDVTGQAKGLRATFVDTFGEGAGNKLFTGLATGAAVAGAAVSGYMAGAAEDSTTSLLSIGTTAASVFAGFQAGGPIGGLLAAAAAGIGYFFGKAAKEAREAAEAQKDYTADVAKLRQAFDDAGVDKFSSRQAKALVVAVELNKTLRGTGEDATKASDALQYLGVDFGIVATSAADGSLGMEALNAELDRATNRRAGIITQQSLDGVEKFGHLTGVAADALGDLKLQVATAAQGTELPQSVTGAKNLGEFIQKAQEAGLELGSYNEVVKEYQGLLQKRLADSPAAQYIASLPAKTRSAIAEQTRLAEVQKLANEAADAQRGGAEKFSAAYDEVGGSLDTATSAYKNWLTGLQGNQAALADVKLSVLDYAKQLRDLGKDPDLSPYEKQQKQISLVAEAQQTATTALSRFVDESGGNFDTFKGKASGLALELTNGLAESLEISKDEAALLVGQIIKVPDEKTFRVLADTTDAKTGLADVQADIATYITSDVRNTVALESTTAEGKALLINKLVDDYAAKHPEAVADLNIDDPQTKAALVDGLLAGLDGKTATATVVVDAHVTQAYKDAVATLTRLAKNPNVNERNLYIPGGFASGVAQNAAGSIVRSPILSLVGEAGPELILPLTNVARMAELLEQLGLGRDAAAAMAAALGGSGGNGPGVAALAAGGAVGVSPVAPAVDQAAGAPGVAEWVAAAVAEMAKLPALVEAATLPGLTVWQGEVAAIFAAVAADLVASLEADRLALYTWATLSVPQATLPALAVWRGAVVAQLLALQSSAVGTVQATAAGMVGALSIGLATMEADAGTGGQRIVDALAGQLEAGTARIKTVVVAYRNSLADALNPVLAAVGEQRLTFAKGGAVEQQRLARGGYVDGPDVRRDVVPALLMPGEVVIRRASVEQFGLGNMLALNDGRRPAGWKVPGYAEGGQVTGDTVGLNGEFLRRLGNWSGAVGQTYNVDSGYRSIQEQARLYSAYLAGTGNLAAPPGSSMHNFGLASDGNHWKNRNPAAFGLAFTVPTEAWHVEPVEARRWAKSTDGSVGGLGDFQGLVPFPQVPGSDKLGKGALADVAAAAMGFTRAKALAWAQAVSFTQPGELDVAGGGAVSSSQAAAWVRAAMALTGVPASWLGGLLTIGRRESNFDPRAVNLWDSNARKGTPSKGFMQMIEPTFRANALPGLGNIFDPVANIAAAIRYIQARYGDISRVQQANPNLPPKGYANGGLVMANDRAGSVVDLTRRPGPGDFPPGFGPAGGGGSVGGVHIAGNVEVAVTPPGSHDPESYAAALGHRAVPMLAALATRTG